MKTDPKQPPKRADRFLQFYCNPKLLEQIQGDLYELYYWRAEVKGESNAKKAFVWDVIRFFRWRNIKRNKTQKQRNNMLSMFKNYLKIGFRNILKQKTPSFINIFGLACAIACCLVAYLFVSSVWLKGIHHKNREQIYMLTHTAESNNEVTRYGHVATPIAELIDLQFPQVEKVTTVNAKSGVIQHKAETFSERIHYVNPEFMDMFSYEIQYGSAEALKNPKGIIITERLAQKLFNIAHPVGKDLQIVINGEPELLTIGAVISNLPSTAMFDFDILINEVKLFGSMAEMPVNKQWNKQSWVFVQTEKVDEVTAGLSKLKTKQNEVNPAYQYLGIQLEPLTTIIQNAREIKGGIGDYGSIAPQILLGAISVFMLSLAIFNYVNIAVLMATKRVKEIGVRKAIGGRRGQLIFQFLSENLITCVLAFVAGGIIAASMFLPWFNNIASKNLQLNLWSDPYLLGFSALLIVFITLASGAYPSLYISSFNATHIFSGKYKIKGKGGLTNTLLTFQFVLSIITIVAGLAFVQTNNTNQHRDWGYNNSDKIVVNVPTQQDYVAIKNSLIQHSSVKATAGSKHILGQGIEENMVTYDNEDYELDIVRASANFGDLMGFRLKQGRLLSPELTSDSSAIVVNQTFLDWFDVAFPLNHEVTIDSAKYEVVGVVEDFHYNHFAFTIVPTAVMLTPESNFNYLTIEVADGTADKMKDVIRQAWVSQVDNQFYDGRTQASLFDPYFSEMKGISDVLLFTATLAIILSTMGLFGLVSLNITAKLKDFGIRKVLGANIMQLSKRVSKKFIIMWIIGSIIGGTLAFFAISMFLDMIFAYHPGLGATPFIVAIGILLMVIVTTIAAQMLRVKNTNPVHTLRVE